MHYHQLCGGCCADKACAFLHRTKNSGQFLEQQTNIKFYVNLGKNASDTCTVLSKAYGEEAMRKSSVEWHKRFKESFFLTEHRIMKVHWGSRGIAPHILNLGTRWR
jgi:hypothetical protein